MQRAMLGAALLGAFVLAATGVRADVGLPLAQAPAEQVGMSAKKLERIREVLKGEIDQGKLPGNGGHGRPQGQARLCRCGRRAGQERRQGDGARFRSSASIR